MLSPGVEVAPEDIHPSTAPIFHRGYVRLTRQDLTDAVTGWLKVRTIGTNADNYCVVGHVTGVRDVPADPGAIAFECETRAGQPLRGLVTSTSCTSFHPIG